MYSDRKCLLLIRLSGSSLFYTQITATAAAADTTTSDYSLQSRTHSSVNKLISSIQANAIKRLQQTRGSPSTKERRKKAKAKTAISYTRRDFRRAQERKGPPARSRRGRTWKSRAGSLARSRALFDYASFLLPLPLP